MIRTNNGKIGRASRPTAREVAARPVNLYDCDANMQRTLTIIVFLMVVLGILAAAHYYIWARLVRDVGCSPSTKRWLTAGVIALGLSIPTSFILSRQLPPKHGLWVLYVTYTWMGSLLTLLIVLAAGDLLRVLIEQLMGQEVNLESHPERRLFLQRALAVGATLLTGVSTTLAIKEALAEVEIRNVRVRLARLPAEITALRLRRFPIFT